MSLLVTAGEDVRLWNVPDLSLQKVRNGTNANVLHCICSPNGQYVAYTYEEVGIRISSMSDDDLPVIEIPTPIQQSSVAFNGHSRYLVSGGLDCVINIWDIKSRTVKRTYKNHFNPVTYCQFNYNDNIIASSSDHGDIILTNVSSGECSDPLTGNDDSQAVRCLGYSHFSRSLLASVSDSGAVCLWDTKEQKMLKKFTDHKAPGTCLSFSPLNDMLLCSSGLDKRIIFYDVIGKKTVKTINTEGPITSCDFFSDGCTVACGSASGHVYLFDLRHGSVPIKVVAAHKTSVRSVAFQRVPKENKSPKKSIDESTKASNRRLSSSSDPENSFQTPASVAVAPRVERIEPSIRQEKSSEGHIGVTPASRENSATSFGHPRENSSSNLRNGDRSVDRPHSMYDVRMMTPPSRENSASNISSLASERPPLPSKSKSSVQSSGGSMQNLQNVGMGRRENSTLALNRLINMNQTPEQVAAISAIPPKAAKLMGDEIFSPILSTEESRSSTLPRKLKVSKQKSLGRNKHAVNKDDADNEEPERPSYGRSKSGLSRLSMLAKSTEDVNSIKKEKKEKDLENNDLHDGKRAGSGILGGFKSPFKKGKKNNSYNKHSDESETSSIDSLSLEDRNLRGKKDRLSNRSNESTGYVSSSKNNMGGTPMGSRNAPPPPLQYNLDRPIDTDQLMTDIQNSLAAQSHPGGGATGGMMSKSPSIHSGEFRNMSGPNTASIVNGEIFQYGEIPMETQPIGPGGVTGPGRPSQIQVDFIQRMIDEAMEDNRAVIHNDMVSLQVEMLRQMEIQKEQIRQMMQQFSINGDLLMEIDRLRTENEKLRYKY